ncbi:4Fe-4S binding protein [Geoalkalibacter sp.]|uniref:4Fe-4S binding protein n=1 Tax=Geoalkalibacter sp. TaxID=3041440 RepID=UPI00272EE102|nr:4Fe-4S binding protein [Geoalkalibacter sp.]
MKTDEQAPPPAEKVRPAKRRMPPMLPRYLVQAGFALFYVWLALRFARWVALLKAGQLPEFARPAAVDGFLPISGLMGLRHWFETGSLFPVHPAAALILFAALLTALLFKRGFCSWVCPVFPLSEGLWRLGQKLCGRTFAPPFWLDLPLRALKYLLLGFFAYQILWSMPLPGLRAFLAAPYHKLADVRMLEFFQQPSATALSVITLLALACFFVQMAWCRYLCPYGALLGVVSLLSLGKIRRDERLCIRCGLCSARCPAWLPVMHKKTLRSAECYACYRCVHGCPVPGAVELKLAGRLRLPSLVFGALVVAVFIGVCLWGRLTGNWQGQVSPMEVLFLLRRGG